MNTCAQICKLIFKALKFPIYVYIEKKLKTPSYPHILEAQTENHHYNHHYNFLNSVSKYKRMCNNKKNTTRKQNS